MNPSIFRFSFCVWSSFLLFPHSLDENSSRITMNKESKVDRNRLPILILPRKNRQAIEINSSSIGTCKLVLDDLVIFQMGEWWNACCRNHFPYHEVIGSKKLIAWRVVWWCAIVSHVSMFFILFIFDFDLAQVLYTFLEECSRESKGNHGFHVNNHSWGRVFGLSLSRNTLSITIPLLSITISTLSITHWSTSSITISPSLGR